MGHCLGLLIAGPLDPDLVEADREVGQSILLIRDPLQVVLSAYIVRVVFADKNYLKKAELFKLILDELHVCILAR